MNNICPQNVVQWKYEVAENWNTKVKYLKIILEYSTSLVILNFDTKFFFSKCQLSVYLITNNQYLYRPWKKHIGRPLMVRNRVVGFILYLWMHCSTENRLCSYWCCWFAGVFLFTLLDCVGGQPAFRLLWAGSKYIQYMFRNHILLFCSLFELFFRLNSHQVRLLADLVSMVCLPG